MDIFSRDQRTILCKARVSSSFILHSCKTIDKDILLQWTWDINGVENFVYMNQNSFCFVISSPATLNETLKARNNDIFEFSQDTLSETKILSETISIPVHSIWESPPPPGENFT